MSNTQNEKLAGDEFAPYYTRSQKGYIYVPLSDVSIGLKEALSKTDKRNTHIHYGIDHAPWSNTKENIVWNVGEYTDSRTGQVIVNVFRQTESQYVKYQAHYKKDKGATASTSNGQQQQLQQQQSNPPPPKPEGNVVTEVFATFMVKSPLYWEDKEGWETIKHNYDAGWTTEDIRKRWIGDGTYLVTLKRRSVSF
jgi:hypothetical protein